jgi:protoheme ferro-lyase
MTDFEARNQEAWDKINAEKEVQRQLKVEAGMYIPPRDVEIFCQYLDDCALEISHTELNVRYLSEMCGSLIEKVEEFWKEQNEKCKVKSVPDYDSQRGISAPVDLNPSRE